MTYLQPGFDPTLPKQRMIATAAVTAGDVYVIDEAVVNSTSLRFTTMVQCAAAAELEHAVFGVALEDIAAGEEGLWGFKGVFDVLCAGTIALEDQLAGNPTNDSVIAASPAANKNEKIIAKPLETGTATTLRCLFNGVEGFGYQSGAAA